MASNTYHLDELRIANTPGDSRRILPPVLETDRTILDVGCGAGQTLLATTFAPGTTVIGLDRDQSALELGRRMDQQLSFVCARGEHLPLRTESLDFVFSRVALPYMHLDQTLSEMRRVLKSGGRVWLVLHPYSMVLRETVAAVSQLRIRRAAVCVYVMCNGIVLNSLGKEFHLPFRKDYYESFQTVRGITKLLRRAGFEDIKAERNRFFVATARKTGQASASEDDTTSRNPLH